MFGADVTAVLTWAGVIAGAAGAQLRDPGNRDRVTPAVVLSELGPHGVSQLTASLRHTDPDVRRHAAWGLGQSAGDTHAARELARLLGDPSEVVRNEAADALANLGPVAETALKEALNSTDATTRAAAFRAFGSTAPRRGGVLLPLDYTPRGLRKVGQPSFVGTGLSRSLQDPDFLVRRAAIDYLTRVAVARRLPDVREDALPGLRAALFDTNAEIRERAAGFLGTLGEKPADLIQKRDTVAVAAARATEQELFAAATPPRPIALSVFPAMVRHIEARQELVRLLAVNWQFRADRSARFPNPSALLDRLAATDPITHHLLAYQLADQSTDPRIGRVFLAGMTNSDPGIREEAVRGLAQFHTKLPPAEVVVALRSAAEDSSPRVRSAVFEARLKLLPFGDARLGDERLRAIVARLRDSDQQTQTAAFQATPKLGALALPALEKATRDPDPNVRRLAIMFLAAVVREMPDATPAHAARVLEETLLGLSDPSNVVRWQAASQLSTQQGSRYDLYGPHVIPKELAERLFAKLAEVIQTDPDRRTRAIAVASFRTFGERAADVILPLFDDPNLREYAAYAAPYLGRRSIEAVPGLRKLLREGSKRERSAAFFPLKEIGSGAVAAIPDLIALLDEPDYRSAAAEALSGVDATGEHAVPALVKLMTQPEFPASERRALFRYLLKYGPNAALAVPHLARDLKDSVSYEAVELAGAIGPKAAAAVPFLVAALDHADPTKAPFGTARALARIGVKSDDVLRVLGRQAKSTDPRAAIPAAAALVLLADDRVAAGVVEKHLDPKSGDLCRLTLDEVAASDRLGKRFAEKLRAVADVENDYRIQAVWQLTKLGEGERHIAYLIDQLEKRGYDYGLATKLLGEIGPPAKAALPVLRKVLPTVRYESEARAILRAIEAIEKPR